MQEAFSVASTLDADELIFVTCSVLVLTGT
jgi:hypothetical protein